MIPSLWFWAPQFHYPLSGAVQQRIDPDWFFGAIPTQAGNGAIEKKAFDLASYGSQLGWITEVLLADDPEAKVPPAKAAEARVKLRKAYRKRVVVSDVSLMVESGEVVGLLGPNGAGKTTCFYMIVGLVPLDGGAISLDGNDVSRLPIYRRSRLGLAYLPQEASIFRKLTVTENIQAVLELGDLSEEEIETRRDALLDELHIAHLRNSPAW